MEIKAVKAFTRNPFAYHITAESLLAIAKSSSQNVTLTYDELEDVTYLREELDGKFRLWCAEGKHV